MTTVPVRRHNHVRRLASDRVFDGVLYTIAAILTLTALYPMYFIIIASISDPSLVAQGKILLLPRGVTLEGYEHLASMKNLWVGYGNTILYTIAGTAIMLVVNIPVAYALSRRDLVGRRWFTMFFVFPMFFGGGLIPFYFVCKDIFGTDNLWVLVLPFGINTFNMIVLRNFFSQVPESIIESCRLDGASEFTILLLFVIPLSKAGLATVILFYVVGKWDDWYWPMIFLTKNTHLSPLALELRNVLTMGVDRPIEDGEIDWTQIFSEGRNAAMICISLLPILCIYPFLQKYFTKGVMIGGVKA